ncbi:TPA: siphovirus ReqiPepy6 Gp37-like family protein [Salmonella enterica subsp. enterica serovar Typhi str. AG3]|nr:siphovirus ReqiPepy6 Gp37-like family protein [Salmonella enterica subsp. enterica serovar Typhi str. AG3]
MIELNVFDLNFNRVGEISEYVNLEIQKNYYTYSELILRIVNTSDALEKLQIDNILTTSTNLNYGYIIEHFEYSDDESEITIYAYSLNWLLSWRTILKQQTYKGNVEDAIKYYINTNAINTHVNRIIPNLRLAENSGINITVDTSKSGGEVSEYCFSVCEVNEITFDILMNHEDKKYDVYTWQGEDRSTLQNINPHIIFSKEFENVENQNYVYNKVDYKNVAVVAGEGEDVARVVAIANDGISGFDRREVYIDARDIQSKYTNDNDVEITLTPTEYNNLLIARGSEDLAEYQPIETFESDIVDEQFVFGRDYGLGDKVSVRNDDIGRVLHTRVTKAIITSNRNGVDIKTEFGSNIPTYSEKIVKKVVKYK